MLNLDFKSHTMKVPMKHATDCKIRPITCFKDHETATMAEFTDIAKCDFSPLDQSLKLVYNCISKDAKLFCNI